METKKPTPQVPALPGMTPLGVPPAEDLELTPQQPKYRKPAKVTQGAFWKEGE